MNIIRETTVEKILSIVDSESTKLLRWHTDNNVIAAGNNLTSEISRLTIEYEKNGTAQKCHLFLKIPVNSCIYEIANSFGTYRKEAIMYTELLPKIYSTIDDQYFTPRVYHVDELQSIYLEDLSQSGYKVADRIEQLDFEHCLHALQTLAKFHAFSIKIENSERIPDILRKKQFFSHDNKRENLKNACLAGLTKFHDNLPADIRAKYVNEIAHFKSINFDDLVSIVNPCDTFNVLNHGDFWTNNIMFKYNKFGLIEDTKIIDFQLGHWANPALDLLYFTVCSMKFQVYVEYFDLLLTTYSVTLNKILKTFDCSPYPFDDLKRDIERYYKYGVVSLTCTLPIMVIDPNNPVDMAKKDINNECDVTQLHTTYQQNNYMRIATEWFLHFAQKLNTIQGSI